MNRLLRPDQFDFGETASTPVVSDTLRFVLPVPELAGGGELLRNVDGSSFTHRGEPVGGRGIVFFNEDDQCWETARGDGRDVIIFSPVDEAQIKGLKTKIAELAHASAMLTIDQIKSVIRFAYDVLKVRSAHSSDRAYVAGSMTPTAPGETHVLGGAYRRNASELCRAVYILGAGGFVGAGASAQLFLNGAVILKQGVSVRLVQPASFEQTYRFLDGRPARVAELAAQSP